jgi:hypothetical protein
MEAQDELRQLRSRLYPSWTWLHYRRETVCFLLIAFAATAVLAHGKLESYERDISSVVDGNRLLNVELVKLPGSQRPQRGGAQPINH